MALATAEMMSQNVGRPRPPTSGRTIARRTNIARQPLKTFPNRMTVIFDISGEHRDVPVSFSFRSLAAPRKSAAPGLDSSNHHRPEPMIVKSARQDSVVCSSCSG